MTGKTVTRGVLITGAGRRIGREIALDFAERGWNVAIHYRHSKADAETLAAELSSGRSRAAAVPGDLAQPEDVASLVPRSRDAIGPIHCLINNASEFLFDSVVSMTDTSWNTHLDVNLKAPVFLARSLAASLADGVTGNVINIIDQRVWNLSPEFFSYTVSKAGLWSATRMLAQALAPKLRVNAIGPGPVLQSVHQSKADFEHEWNATLLERGTTPGEIADAIRFILDAPALTGQMLALDGGQHLSWQDGDGRSTDASNPVTAAAAPLKPAAPITDTPDKR